MAKPLDVELRAAELTAAIQHEFPEGGWFAALTEGERRGWDIHEDEWWGASYYDGRAPRNRREWAGWLAREIYTAKIRP